MELLKENESLNISDILEELDIKINPNTDLPFSEHDHDFFFHSMINESGSGIFIFDVDLEMIVWGNDHFHQLNNLKQEYLFHHSFMEITRRKLHPEDARYLNDLKKQSNLHNTNFYASKAIRIKQQNAVYKFYRLVLVSPPSNNYKKFGKIIIGLQYDLTPIFEQYMEMTVSDVETSNFANEADFQKLNCLSKREKQILKLIVKGFTDKEIAYQLHISKYTSETHRKNIIQKLQVKNTACLSFLAGKYGIF